MHVDRYIKIRDHIPRIFGVIDHIEMELTGLRTVRVSHTQTLTSEVFGSFLSGQGEQEKQTVISLVGDIPNRSADVEIYINMPNKSTVRMSVSPGAHVCDVTLMINYVANMRDQYLVYASKVLRWIYRLTYSSSYKRARRTVNLLLRSFPTQTELIPVSNYVEPVAVASSTRSVVE